LDPFSPSKSKEERRETLTLWKNIIIAALPAGVVGLLSDDKLSATVFREPQVRYVIAGALLFYGIWFIVIERKNKGRTYKTVSPEKIGTKTALGIGVFQVLALIPGTSRSGSTIIGSSALGVSRTASAEFSFFLAVPVMLGASSLKIVKFASSGASFTLLQFSVLATGTLVAFLVSLATVKFLVGFVRRHSFEGFGWYRIALALAVTVYFAFIIK
ncbi:MAG: undecaprenyl-diphosphate phosphatase, partial [Clostridia bacterium]|nr:undecaprenyl-diphosphate phosphatase [Clostridia bacterium]